MITVPWGNALGEVTRFAFTLILNKGTTLYFRILCGFDQRFIQLNETFLLKSLKVIMIIPIFLFASAKLV